MLNMCVFINPIVPMDPFPTPWKWCAQGVEKGCIGNKWVKLNSELRFCCNFDNFEAYNICFSGSYQDTTVSTDSDSLRFQGL